MSSVPRGEGNAAPPFCHPRPRGQRVCCQSCRWELVFFSHTGTTQETWPAQTQVSRNSKISFSVLTSAAKVPTQANEVHSHLRTGKKVDLNGFADLPDDGVLEYLAAENLPDSVQQDKHLPAFFAGAGTTDHPAKPDLQLLLTAHTHPSRCDPIISPSRGKSLVSNHRPLAHLPANLLCITGTGNGSLLEDVRWEQGSGHQSGSPAGWLCAG